MATPSFSLAGQKTAAKARLKQPAGKLGLPVICSIIEQHMPNTAWFIDDESTTPQQTASNDLIIEGLGRIGAKRILANKPEELTELSRPSGRTGIARTGFSMRVITANHGTPIAQV